MEGSVVETAGGLGRDTGMAADDGLLGGGGMYDRPEGAGDNRV